jgi:hypothetical protein
VNILTQGQPQVEWTTAEVSSDSEIPHESFGKHIMLRISIPGDVSYKAVIQEDSKFVVELWMVFKVIHELIRSGPVDPILAQNYE